MHITPPKYELKPWQEKELEVFKRETLPQCPPEAQQMFQQLTPDRQYSRASGLTERQKNFEKGGGTQEDQERLLRRMTVEWKEAVQLQEDNKRDWVKFLAEQEAQEQANGQSASSQLTK